MAQFWKDGTERRAKLKGTAFVFFKVPIQILGKAPRGPSLTNSSFGLRVNKDKSRVPSHMSKVTSCCTLPFIGKSWALPRP